MSFSFKSIFLATILLISINNPIDGYYVVYKDGFKKSPTQSLLPSDAFTITRKSNDIFPDEFALNFKSFDEKFNYQFYRVDGLLNDPASTVNSFVLDKHKNLVKTKSNLNIKHHLYVSENNNAVATIIENSDLNERSIVKTNDQFRMIITISEGRSTNEFDIVPVIIQNENSQRTFGHVITKRQVTFTDMSLDYAIPPKDQTVEKIHNIVNEKKLKIEKDPRAPVELYVELGLFLDYSVLEKNMLLLNTLDEDLVISYMLVYYAHFLRDVNQRYVNSMQNDPDLRIYVRLTHVIIASDAVMSSWSDMNLAGYGEYYFNGRQVVSAYETLKLFSVFVDGVSQFFPYEIDHAMGILDKDIWSDDESLTENQRSGVLGIAWLNYVCGNYKYSILEDNGFHSLIVVTHELGHNLGSYHDGQSNVDLARPCPPSDNYIMTSTLGLYQTNLDHFFLFSNCSINQFKRNLLSNGNVDESKKCLTNVASNIPIYFEDNLPGQLYNYDEQCKLAYGYKALASPCTQTAVCERLWCSRNGTSPCTSLAGWGAPDGSSCGPQKVCKTSFCVDDDILTATNFPDNICSHHNPCMNDGTCVQISGRFYICQCKPYFTGQNCQIRDEPQTSPQPTSSRPNSSNKLPTFEIKLFSSILLFFLTLIY